MVDSNNPKLLEHRTGIAVDINANPFSIGRGLGCNYVIPNKVVSRTHCVLEKHDDHWILVDSSTNGTYINNRLVKGAKSGPLKDRSIIGLDMSNYLYTFCLPSSGSDNMDDISDEQLCLFADSVLNEVEAFQNDQNGDADLSVMEVNEPNIVSSHPLHDHVGMVKSQERHDNKKPRIETSTGQTMVIDLANSSNPDESATDQPGPSVQSTNVAPDKAAKDTESALQPPKETPQDNFEVMENELQCAICSELFIKAVTLNCSHTFCKYCIDLWKKTKSECPICRARITSITATLVLDNVVDKVMETSPEEQRTHRKQIVEEREREQQAALAPPPPAVVGGRARRGRSARGRTRPNVGLNAVVTTGAVIPAVIELSSDSDWDEASSNTDSGETGEWQDEYDNDYWYEDGVRGAYYGGYGYCYSCGRPGHWSNGCPYR